MRRLCAVVLLIVGLIVSVGATQASAGPALLAIDNAAPALEQDDDGKWSGTLGITNLTDSALTLSAAAADSNDADCKIKLSRAAIGAAQSSELKVTVPKKCDTKQESFEFNLTAKNATAQNLPVVAKLSEGDDPDWSQLKWFFIALPVAALVLFGVFVLRGKYPIGKELEYLEATYSFKESWVSNITVVAAFLTGLFGSADVVKAFLGEDADRSIALATVGSAIALIFIGSGPIILTAAKKRLEKDGVLSQVFTVWGLLLATAVSVAGAFGQLWVGWQSGKALEPDGWEDWKTKIATIGWDAWVTIGFLVLVALLVWYTLATVGQTLKAGTTKPPPAKPTELAQLIALIRDALTKNEQVPDEAIAPVMKEFLESIPVAVPSVGDEHVTRRRAAML